MRNNIVEAARVYLGVAWVDKARTKWAVDCIGLIIMVARDLGMVEADFDFTGYGLQANRTIAAEFRRRMAEINKIKAGPGDVVLIRDGTLPRHCGILSTKNGEPHMIHAYSRVTVRRVLEEPMAGWRGSVTHAFRFPGAA